MCDPKIHTEIQILYLLDSSESCWLCAIKVREYLRYDKNNHNERGETTVDVSRSFKNTSGYPSDMCVNPLYCVLFPNMHAIFIASSQYNDHDDDH